MVGSDCLSIDPFGGADRAAHRRRPGTGILIGDAFANLGALPPGCAFAFIESPAEQPARG